MVNKKEKSVICTSFCKGRQHDFKLFKGSKVRFKPTTQALVDSGYQGIQRLHANSKLPKKKTKKRPLTQEEKLQNQQISSDRVLNENVIGMLKRFKIIADRYRNRRKRFGLRFNLIAGLYNYELNI